MSWINDVSYELNKLDKSDKSLKKFGITIGTIFLILSVYFIYVKSFIFALIFGLPAISLLFLGILGPKNLISTYKIWMGIAFVLGWFVSRFILTLLFCFILFPIGIIAKIFKKQFLNLKFNTKANTYWIKKENIGSNYEKLY